MKKCLICILILALLCASACAHSFIDAAGRRVQVENPARTVALYHSYGDAWLNAGGTLVGTIADHFEDGTLDASVQNLGSHIRPNMELLFSLNPDFVLLSADVAGHREIAQLLDQAGINYAFFSTPDYADYMEMMNHLCTITGREDLYLQQTETVQKPIEEIIARAKTLSSNPTALLIRANSTAVKCRNSRGTVAGNILRDMGFVNLADGDSTLCENIGMEAVLAQDPDYIFVVLQGSGSDAAQKNLASVLTGNPAWNTLTAVREGRFYVLDRALFHYHPNARWAESYRFILDILEGE